MPPLQALHAAGFDIAVVISRPDRRRGRGSALTPSPVKAAASELGLTVTDDLDAVTAAGVELGVVVAYGRIIPRRILEQVPMVNLHFSLLPRWRGAAPVERALLGGDDRTGVCLMEVAEGLDTGAVYAVEETAIDAHDTLDSLRGRLVDMGGVMLVDTLLAGLPDPVEQDGEVTHAAKIDPGEREIDWTAPAEHIDRLVRLGGAWTSFRGARLKVWQVGVGGPGGPDGGDDGAAQGSSSDGGATDEGVVTPEALAEPGVSEPGALDGLTVATGAGSLTLVEVQPEGKGRQAAAAWANGHRPEPGERLGE